MNNNIRTLTLAAIALLAISPALIAEDSRPNILLIVADDLGYADLGIYGSDIRTPNIDALAREGIRFSQFQTAPMCAPTRAMLLSGNNNHVAGMARQHPAPPLKGDMTGYDGHLSERVMPLQRVLKNAGYHTYMAGKWHLGVDEHNSPKATGFDRSYGVVQGGASHYDGRGFENGESIYREDGKLTTWPDGEYSTELYTDKLIGYIEENRTDGKPFFVFAAYTSPHWPLQVPDDELDRYRGVYDAGYDSLRETNFANLQAAGIVPATSTLPPRNENIRPWADLSEAEKRIESREMELYAAMVENLDHHIGRLFAYLRENNLYENTLIVFMSDNGAAGEDFYNRGPFVEYVRERYDNTFENMGRPDSFVSYDYAWAEAGSAPFKHTKTFTTQGGITAPMIAAGPGVRLEDVISHSHVTLMDIAPTFIEAANGHYPDDGSVEPMQGKTLSPLLGGETETIHSDEETFVLFHRNRAYVRKGNWKLTSIERPFDEAHFSLHNLADDPGETTDLSEAHPEKHEELLQIWRAERRELGIVLPMDL